MPSTNLSFRAPDELLEKIQARDFKGVKYPGVIAKREVERWYAVLGHGLAEVRLSPEETVVLIYFVGAYHCEATHEQVLSLREMRYVGLDGDFRPSWESLREKARQWPLATLYAAWDAAERYWVMTHRLDREDAWPEDTTFGMALHRVGLHPYDLSPEELAHVERMRAAIPDELPGAYLREMEV